ncbi:MULTISPECIES: hypothetical protein [unclassified Undibacterium]|uniref:hypothetical protein n=1 Tax=unclassified Undibacterium TaxID=2630295 RepID=UPI002AC9402E|nr:MULTISPECIES: hypothetical protein [unclassified Undibacterium]MEB0141167.1 hypothetical protein [Undibacterium sp. CCC2.1]MEB0174200.1 hypothetical protein [Undibacterium sp. CCC1.1]MEB0178152.1 hypothetical protein [Undibacterium sp. CCC3.4]MEB0217357.1 hypothetical protein [Undibacterium sp. 5I2]WPX44702.1 hypothetical protein RHM61_05590 [Undibacterium sp. CCC3.4]
MNLKPLIVLLAMSAAVSSAWAEEDSRFTFSGFGTAALTRSNTSDAEFARPNQVAGVTTTPRTGVDSNLGLQLTAKATDWLSATGQGLVRKNVTDSFGAELSWLFVKAKVSDSLSFRAGRIGLPVYMISDYRNVGYANTMIRPPVEMYTQVPMESVDGVDAVYQTSFGETAVTAQFAYGKTDSDNAAGFTVKLRNMSGIHLLAENGPFTVRFGRVDSKLTVDNGMTVNALLGALTHYGFSSVASQLAVNNTKASFTSLGLGVDWKNIVVQAEYGKRKTDSLTVPNTTSWYTMAGYRIGAFLPYFNHASATQDSARSVAGLPTSGPLQVLSLGANTVASNAVLQTSNSVGVRWDFNKSAALKVQIDRMTPTAGSNGVFVNAKPGFSGPVTVLAAGVDFVF